MGQEGPAGPWPRLLSVEPNREEKTRGAILLGRSESAGKPQRAAGLQEGPPRLLRSGGLLLGSVHLLLCLPYCLLPGLTRFSCISTPQWVCFHVKIVF